MANLFDDTPPEIKEAAYRPYEHRGWKLHLSTEPTLSDPLTKEVAESTLAPGVGKEASHISTRVNMYGSRRQQAGMKNLSNRYEDLSQRYPTVAANIDEVNLHSSFKGTHPWQGVNDPVNHAWASVEEEAGFKNEIFMDVGKTRPIQIPVGISVSELPDWAEQTLIHEFGHQVHFELNRRMGIPVGHTQGIHEDVKNIIAEEFGHESFDIGSVAKSIGSAYAATNERELMAELFARSEVGGKGSREAKRVFERINPILSPNGAEAIPKVIPKIPLGETMRNAGQLAKDATNMGIEAIKSRAPIDAARVVELAKTHPKSLLTVGLAAGLLLRHHRKKKNDNIGAYATTITRGSQSAPSGSAAGMNNAPSAWIQMNGTGYANPAYQGAKYGFTRGYPMAGTYPTMSRPMSNSQVSRVLDNRYGDYDIAQDQRLSSMI